MPVLTADIRFTTVYDGDHFQVSAEIISGTMPRAVFLYRNAQEATQLTQYVGVATKDQMTRYPVWVPGPDQPLFGVPFVRHTIGVKAHSTFEETELWKQLTEKDAEDLKGELELIEPLVEVVSL
jgi:hypothetical protein